MDCPHIKQIVGVIKNSTQLTTNALVAKKLGVTESTLRGYWDCRTHPSPYIPDRSIDRFLELLNSVLPKPINKDEAIDLLQGTEGAFQLALKLPVCAEWERFLDTYNSLELKLKKENLSSAHGFGEIAAEEDGSLPTILQKQGFLFSASTPWSGVGILIARHQNVWHLETLSLPESRESEFVLRVDPGEVTFPSQSNKGRIRQFTIAGIEGRFDYFAILLRGERHNSVLSMLPSVNPISEQTLGLVGAHLTQYPPSACLVGASSFMLRSSDE